MQRVLYIILKLLTFPSCDINNLNIKLKSIKFNKKNYKFEGKNIAKLNHQDKRKTINQISGLLRQRAINVKIIFVESMGHVCILLLLEKILANMLVAMKHAQILVYIVIVQAHQEHIHEEN